VPSEVTFLADLRLPQGRKKKIEILDVKGTKFKEKEIRISTCGCRRSEK